MTRSRPGFWAAEQGTEMEHIAILYVIFSLAFASLFLGYQHGFIAGIGATKPNIFRVAFASLLYGIAWPYHLAVAFFR